MVRCGIHCPLCYAGVRGRASYPGHRGGRRAETRRKVLRAMGMLKKPLVRETGGLSTVQPQGAFAKSYPAAFAFLAETTWEDGSPREPGSILLVCGDGLVKVWAHDKNGMGSSLWVSGETFEDVLASLDDLLCKGAGDWRVDRPKSSAGGRRRT